MHRPHVPPHHRDHPIVARAHHKFPPRWRDCHAPRGALVTRHIAVALHRGLHSLDKRLLMLPHPRLVVRMGQHTLARQLAHQAPVPLQKACPLAGCHPQFRRLQLPHHSASHHPHRHQPRPPVVPAPPRQQVDIPGIAFARHVGRGNDGCIRYRDESPHGLEPLYPPLLAALFNAAKVDPQDHGREVPPPLSRELLHSAADERVHCALVIIGVLSRPNPGEGDEDDGALGRNLGDGLCRA
mmetsp:Transcript_8434/g.19593  ORF Transcript_8434/g.19593 Transcript_8434/m.19593 type:complete len:240 (+) Transcript_8434:669-1388(+)